LGGSTLGGSNLGGSTLGSSTLGDSNLGGLTSGISSLTGSLDLISPYSNSSKKRCFSFSILLEEWGGFSIPLNGSFIYSVELFLELVVTSGLYSVITSSGSLACEKLGGLTCILSSGSA